ncbi:MAG: sigma-54-dependent Fis family transcriptional regulator [Deltaproteobacteria bacterium]|nr:sigma-54-dependent Fis family transcriptional regulator [Deltaproteobacteria bacterium]
MKWTILVVDDESSHRAMIRAHLEAEGYQVREAGTAQEALDVLGKEHCDLVLSDIRMPQMDGITGLQKIMSQDPAQQVMMMTAYGSIESAVECLKMGAFDYIQKPLDMEEVLIKIKKALEYRGLKEENRLHREQLENKFNLKNLVGSSPSMMQALETMLLVAATPSTVLLLGESGTGKEVAANVIHQNSPRRDRPFVKVNCAALPETLLESELFGHERGAFTGAVSRRKGRFETADGGSIFLDEIGDMSLTTQAKMLRVIQERTFEPLGSSIPIEVDVRIITATNKDLEAAVAQNEFRRDLYYRLNVVPIHLPPLRERWEDVVPLAEHFLHLVNLKTGKKIKGFDPKVIEYFRAYEWPGNVRELENAVERGVIMTRGDLITLAELPQAIARIKPPAKDGCITVTPGTPIRDMERELVIATLEHTSGNRTKSAQLLGITRKSLQNKIKEYGLDL